ncbi:50S ribosomal protein L10 [Patescibacteria group bacterium]|nr:50S ribosomal protein L10 [Patescibacteria group bacterium]
MAINKNKKKDLITLYTDLINTSEAIVFLDTQHLNVKVIEAFRKSLANFNSKYILIKNTLLKKAFEQSNKEMLEVVENLSGYNACIFLNDNIVDVMKLITDFAKINESNINFGILGSYTMNSLEINDLSKISSKEQLIVGLLSVLNSGITRIIYNINYHNQMLVNVISNISNSKGGE